MKQQNGIFALMVGLMMLNSPVLGQESKEQVDDAAEVNESPKGEAQLSLPLDEIQMFAEVFERIRTEYVDEVDEATLIENAISGMLKGLDPHSTFLPPRDYEDLIDSSQGKFGGLGIEVMMKDDELTVISPIDETPASLAGIEAGDVIVMIDGKPVEGLGLRENVEKMRGKPGTEITLTIFREGEDAPLELTLVRANIKTSSVKSDFLEPGLAYARVSSFQQNTAQELRFRISRMTEESDKGEGIKLKGLVLDLRNNPGGNLNSAVEISDMFLTAGEIVSTRGRKASSMSQFDAKPDDVLNGLPLVVLVNRGSASASEIVAGALQDHSRALIVGTRTFGKGSVQVGSRMNNGAGLKLTIARYYTPSGRSIQATGIQPDVVIREAEYLDEKDIRKGYSESDLAGHLENSVDGEEKKKEKTKQSILLDDDYALNEALNILKGMSLVNRANN